jgi:protein-tyrosine phosphatase
MRWITLDGAVNVRDIGGLPTEEGALTAGKRLLRADNLQQLSPADVSLLLGEFGLTRVVDLRSVAEVTAEGPGPLVGIESIDHVHHSMIPVEDDAASSAELVSRVLLARRDRFASTDPDEYTIDSYLGYLTDRPESVVAALRAIASTPGAALVHCAAGKDRTGVIVALALRAVGVRREAVIADYAATAVRIDAILARLRASDTYGSSINRISDEQHTPRESSMARFLDRVDADHGGVLTWLADQGFGPADLRRLRAKLLAA